MLVSYDYINNISNIYMIVKLSKLIGNKILTQDGTKIEDVEDILYDQDKKSVVALLVKKGGMFNDPRVLMREDIHEIGKDAVMVKSGDVIKKPADISSRIEDLSKNSATRLTNSKLVDDRATEYGKISDVFFESSNGQVVGLEYTSDNESKSKKTMKIQEIIGVGPDAIVVKPVMVDAQGKTKHEKEKMETTHKNTIKVEQDNDTQTDPEFTSEERERIQDTIGKYATKNILLPTDDVLIKRNEVVTHESLRVAYTYGLLDQVIQNTSQSPV